MESDILLFFEKYFSGIFHNLVYWFLKYQIFFVYFKIIAFILSLFFLIGIIFYVKKLKVFQKIYNRYLNIFGLSTDFLSTKRCQKSWKEIKKLLQEPYDSSFKLAVLKAFSTVKKTLEILGYPADFKEAINKLSKEGYRNLEVIENIYQITEKILNEKNFILKKEEAERIVSLYYKFFQEILYSIS